MIPFTTVLNVPRIPSVIPMKIRPPVEKTSRTPAHALEKMLLNQLGIVENMLVIVFQAPWKIPRKNSTTPENTALMPPQMPLNHEPATLNTFTILDHAFLNIVPNHVATFDSAFTTSFHLSLNHCPIALNTFTMLFHAFVNIVENHVATSLNAVTMSFQRSANH